MLNAAIAALTCLCLARTSQAEPHNLRAYTHNTHSGKNLSGILASIEERLRALDTISAVQAKQARRLDIIQEKLDRVETTLSLRLERAQLAADKLEHRLHMLQTNIEASIKETTSKLERSQSNIADIARNLSSHLDSHRHLLEKASGAYVETWRRGLLLESLMRDGLSLVNATRRELADGLRALGRRQREARLTSADMEAAFSRRLNDNTYKIDLKMQELLDAQKHFVDSCQRVQQDDPNRVADVLDKLIDSLINKTASTFQELQKIHSTIRTHDNKVMKQLTSGRTTQNDGACKRLENAFRNTTHTTIQENELHQLTEKFIALTNRADAALQKLELRVDDDPNEPEIDTEVSSAADRLLRKLKKIKSEQESYESEDWDDNKDAGFYDDGGGGDIMDEDKEILSGITERTKTTAENFVLHPLHRRHLHKHPYDRGPV